jgi:hypothetical protein
MFTVYNEKGNRFELVEEPDRSLSHTYAETANTTAQRFMPAMTG